MNHLQTTSLHQPQSSFRRWLIRINNQKLKNTFPWYKQISIQRPPLIACIFCHAFSAIYIQTQKCSDNWAHKIYYMYLSKTLLANNASRCIQRIKFNYSRTIFVSHHEPEIGSKDARSDQRRADAETPLILSGFAFPRKALTKSE